MTLRTKIRSALLRIAAALLLVASGYIVTGQMAAHAPLGSQQAASFSLLAVGDTGKRHRPAAVLTEGQLAVADAMVLEDLRQPVDALVLLGDNFYMHGLRASEMVMRMRENLVLPYCHFMRFSRHLAAEIEPACRESELERHPVPIHAVLGNHDLESDESAFLQRRVVPQYIPNWKMDEAFAAAHELGGGVSLISLSSAEIEYTDEQKAALVEALRSARGRWRILAAHSSMGVGESANEPAEADGSLAFETWVASAIEEAGVRVHLHLAGHHHSLQAIEGGGPLGPALNVVVGSGSRWRAIEQPHPRRLFGLERLGFARVDVVWLEGKERLLVSMLRSATTPVTAWGGAQVVAQWSISENGELAEFVE